MLECLHIDLTCLFLWELVYLNKEKTWGHLWTTVFVHASFLPIQVECLGAFFDTQPLHVLESWFATGVVGFNAILEISYVFWLFCAFGINRVCFLPLKATFTFGKLTLDFTCCR